VARPRDGDVIAVRTANDIARTHAERIALGRGSLSSGRVQRELNDAWRRMTGNGSRQPTSASLDGFWDLIEQRTDGRLLRADHQRYPFTPTERRLFLVVPLDVDVTVPTRRQWEVPVLSSDGLRVVAFRKHFLDWRDQIVARRGLATEADVLNRRKDVRLTGGLPSDIVSART
jgi:hypothetical protein